MILLLGEKSRLVDKMMPNEQLLKQLSKCHGGLGCLLGGFFGDYKLPLQNFRKAGPEPRETEMNLEYLSPKAIPAWRRCLQHYFCWSR